MRARQKRTLLQITYCELVSQGIRPEKAKEIAKKEAEILNYE